MKEVEALTKESTIEIPNDKRCGCLTKEYVPVRYEVVGYGRELIVGVSFIKRQIFAKYDYACDSGTRKSLAIKYCPFCGRKLDKAESEDKE